VRGTHPHTRKRTKRRIVSLVFAVALVFGIAPAAIAQDSTQAVGSPAAQASLLAGLGLSGACAEHRWHRLHVAL
jgi:hypothetical protein